MALEEYVGSIVMEVDSQEIEITDFNVKANTGRKLVKTMNRKGKAKGFARGIGTYDLSITAVIPTEGTVPDWEALEGVKISIYPLNDSASRTSYLDCFTIDAGEAYQVDNEARVDITMSALSKVNA